MAPIMSVVDQVPNEMYELQYSSDTVTFSEAVVTHSTAAVELLPQAFNVMTCQPSHASTVKAPVEVSNVKLAAAPVLIVYE